MRRCTACGKTYFRRSKMEVWTQQNPGSRKGWRKQEAKLCTDCMGPSLAVRVLNLGVIHVTRTNRRKAR